MTEGGRKQTLIVKHKVLEEGREGELRAGVDPRLILAQRPKAPSHRKPWRRLLVGLLAFGPAGSPQSVGNGPQEASRFLLMNAPQTRGRPGPTLPPALPGQPFLRSLTFSFPRSPLGPFNNQRVNRSQTSHPTPQINACDTAGRAGRWRHQHQRCWELGSCRAQHGGGGGGPACDERAG